MTGNTSKKRLEVRLRILLTILAVSSVRPVHEAAEASSPVFCNLFWNEKTHFEQTLSASAPSVSIGLDREE